VKDSLLPHLPAPVRWVGWYEAIEDLIPTLPESKFAAWQLARLPEGLKTVLMAGSGNTNFNDATPGLGARELGEPAHVVSSDGGGRTTRAIIVSHAKTEFGDGIRAAGEPVHAITEQAKGRTRALLVDSAGYPGSEAFMMSKMADKYGDGIREQLEPAQTIGANEHGSKAWLSQGRIVSMTPRALARFQSVPDSYLLPDKASLACKVIGNGYPCLMAQRIAEGLAAN